MIGEEAVDRSGLVGWEGEDVGEAAAREDDRFAGFFWRGDGGSGDDLGGADGGNVGAGAGEGRVKHPAGAVVEGAICGDALAAVAGDAVVT